MYGMGAGHVVKCGWFLCTVTEKPFLGDFRAFRGPGGTTYHKRNKSALNRKNAKNNFFRTKCRKNIIFFLVIKKLFLPLHCG